MENYKQEKTDLETGSITTLQIIKAKNTLSLHKIVKDDFNKHEDCTLRIKIGDKEPIDINFSVSTIRDILTIEPNHITKDIVLNDAEEVTFEIILSHTKDSAEPKYYYTLFYNVKP
jgi:hypothetical protein